MKAKINYQNDNIELKLFTNQEPIAISGHRFVALLGENPFVNDLALFLDFLKLRKITANKYMNVGVMFEKVLLNMIWGKNTYYSFEYEKYNGDMFPNTAGFNGLIDGLHKNLKKIAEVKTYFNYRKLKQKYYDVKNQKSVKKIPREYYLQTRFYLEILAMEKPELNIKEADVITCFIPNVDDPYIDKKYINVFKVFKSNNDNFKYEMHKALAKKNQLFQKHFTKNGDMYYKIVVKNNKTNQNLINQLQYFSDKVDIEIFDNKVF